MQSVHRSRTNLLPLLGALALSAGLTGMAAPRAAHAQTVPPANPETPAATATPAAAAPPQAPPPSITFNALLDGYYVYNFNKPKNVSGAPGSNGPGSRNFDQADNSFSLGLAEIGIAKAVNDTSRLGFTVKLAYGPTADAVASSIDQNNKNILQAYGTYLIPVGGKDLTVDAGKFVTHMGYEVIEPELNWNYSRADIFQYFVPFYHAGVRASYPLSPKFTVNGYVTNGWNDVTSDNNVSKAYGFELTFTPSSKYSIILNGLTSSEPDPYGIVTIPPINFPILGGTDAETLTAQNRAKNVIEPIITYNFSSQFSAVADINIDFGKGATPRDATDSNGSWSSTGYAAYLHYQMPSGSGITLRGEYFDDDKGFLTGIDRQKGEEVTLTYGIKGLAFPGAETRFEYRYDHMDKEGLLPDSSGGLSKKSQNTLGISQLFSF